MNFSTAVSKVLPWVSGCPEDLAIEQLRNAAIEWCTKTRCMQSGVSTNVDGTEVAVSTMVTQVVDIIDAKINGEAACVLRLNDPAVDDLDADEYVIRFNDPNSITITPAPTTTNPVDLDMLVIVAPGPEATEVHDNVWRRHHEALVHGALARLFEVPKRSWSDTALAIHYRSLFNAALERGKSEYHRNVTTAARKLRVRPA